MRIALALALLLARAGALRLPLHAPARCLSPRMESEMEYRKRMAESRDPSKSDEWNRAYARLEKLVPVIVFGKAIGPVDVPALRTAISDALKVGVEFEELSVYDNIAQAAAKGDEVATSPEVEQAAKEAAAQREAADKLVREADMARQRSLMAFSALQAAKPSVAFGRVVGAVDLPAFRKAIDAARDAGVDAPDLASAEKLYELAAGGGATADPRKAMYDAFFEMQEATPLVVFGKVMGKVDVPRLRAAIEAARREGVDESAIVDAERALRQCTEKGS